MAEQPGQAESDAETPSLTDAELEQVAGGARMCRNHAQYEPCQATGLHNYGTGGGP